MMEPAEPRRDRGFPGRDAITAPIFITLGLAGIGTLLAGGIYFIGGEIKDAFCKAPFGETVCKATRDLADEADEAYDETFGHAPTLTNANPDNVQAMLVEYTSPAVEVTDAAGNAVMGKIYSSKQHGFGVQTFEIGQVGRGLGAVNITDILDHAYIVNGAIGNMDGKANMLVLRASNDAERQILWQNPNGDLKATEQGMFYNVARQVIDELNGMGAYVPQQARTYFTQTIKPQQ